LFSILCIVSPFVYNSLFPTFVPVYPLLSPGENPIAVNKYHIIHNKLCAVCHSSKN